MIQQLLLILTCTVLASLFVLYSDDYVITMSSNLPQETDVEQEKRPPIESIEMGGSPHNRYFVRFKGKHSLMRICFVVAITILLTLLISLLFSGTRRFLFKKIEPFTPAPIPTAIDPNFITQVDNCFLPVASVYGYTLRITAGFRSMTEQDLMYQSGRTINGHIVSEAPAGRSIHNYGLAVDVVDRWRGYNIDWNKLVKIGAYCGLESGEAGDLPHFEHRGGLTTQDFIDGKRPAPLTLPCAIMIGRTATSSPLTKKDLANCGAPKF